MTDSRRLLWDIALAAVMTAFLVGEAYASAGLALGPMALATVMGLALVGRRTHPFWTYLIGTAALLAMVTFYYPAGYYPIANVIGLHAVGAHDTGVRSIVGLVVGVGAVTAYWLIAPEVPLPALPAVIMGSWVLAWIAGQAEANRRRSVEERARDTELRRKADVERATMEERNRIAREVHDIVGHSIQVMLLQTGAARRKLGDDVETSAEAMRKVEEVGRETLDELDRVLGVLTAEESRQPLPGMGSIEDLVKRFVDAGVPVSLEVGVDPATIPATVGSSVYRIVQEALTNVARHAPGSGAEVSVFRRDKELVIDVANTGGSETERSSSRSGVGLAGIRERVELLGGSLRAGPTSDGGWNLHCTLPLST